MNSPITSWKPPLRIPKGYPTVESCSDVILQKSHFVLFFWNKNSEIVMF